MRVFIYELIYIYFFVYYFFVFTIFASDFRDVSMVWVGVSNDFTYDARNFYNIEAIPRLDIIFSITYTIIIFTHVINLKITFKMI